MAKLDQQAKWMGPNEWHIVPMVNKLGQEEAAKKLGVNQSSLCRWLKAHGYVARIFWQRAAKPQELEDIEAVAERVNAKRRAEGRPTLDEEREMD